MKKIIMVMMLTVISMGVFAQTKKGDTSVGFNVGYAFDTENALFGLDLRHNLTNEFRLAPSMTYLAKNQGISALMLDLNAHYVFKLNDQFGFYPLGGLNLSFWNPGGDDTLTRFGVNIGLGAEVYATEQVSVALETRYNIVKDIDQALMAVRIGYKFYSR